MNALLKVKTGMDLCDKVTLILHPKAQVTTMISLESRRSLFDLFLKLAVAHAFRHKGDQTVTIDGETYRWTQEEWLAVLRCTEEIYIPNKKHTKGKPFKYSTGARSVLINDIPFFDLPSGQQIIYDYGEGNWSKKKTTRSFELVRTSLIKHQTLSDE